jgi:hypothetical protein
MRAMRLGGPDCHRSFAGWVMVRRKGGGGRGRRRLAVVEDGRGKVCAEC